MDECASGSVALASILLPFAASERKQARVEDRMSVPGQVACAPAATAKPMDRRRGHRYDVRLRILLREDRFATAGYTVNISSSGAFIRTSAPLRLGARYHLSLEMP